MPEIPIEACKNPTKKRHYSSSSESDNETNGKRKPVEERIYISKLQSKSEEYKPQFKNSGSQQSISSGITTDGSWLRKALKRAKEQAAEENKSLEEIAVLRWGSLEKFYTLLDKAEGTSSKSYSHSKTPEDVVKNRNEVRSRSRERRRSRSRERRRSRSREQMRSRSRERRRSRSRERRRSRSRERRRSRSIERSSQHKNNNEEGKRSTSNRMMRPVSDDEDNSYSVSKSLSVPVSSSSQKGWRKKEVEVEMSRRKLIPISSTKVKERSPSPESENVSAETKQQPIILTDQELNKLAAKLTKAEIVGNDALAEKLKAKLEAAREARNSATTSNPSSKRVEEEILLTKTMPSGYTAPMSEGQSMPTKRKHKMAAFLEETRNLKQMFEHEKGISAEDQIEVVEEAALRMGPTLEEDYDDVGGTSDALHKQIGRLQDKQKQRAISEHQSNERSLDSCTQCMANKEMSRHLIVALGTKCYVALLPHEEIANGQCIIVPIHHVQSSLLADEDLWEEIMNYRKALVNFYLSRGEDCVFFETYLRTKSRIPHMIINCIPLPREVGDLSPIYFKKAIDECEGEWSQNKKLVDLKGKGVRRCVPKELSYFFVDFGTCPGYAHVIEDERTFPRTFAEEIVGGMLDVEKFLWVRPPKQSFDVQCKKVMQFIEDFKLFDHTSNRNRLSNEEITINCYLNF